MTAREIAKNTSAAIRKWMQNNVAQYLDECGEVNCTALTEAWDSACSTGEATLDSNHEAWDIAVDVGTACEAAQKRAAKVKR